MTFECRSRPPSQKEQTRRTRVEQVMHTVVKPTLRETLDDWFRRGDTRSSCINLASLEEGRPLSDRVFGAPPPKQAERNPMRV